MTDLNKCPICDGIITPVYEIYVCDVCGFGKNSIQEYKTLQKLINYREKWRIRNGINR